MLVFVIVKKYSNRRLYDTEASCYITLEELAVRVRAGADARVVDAKTGEDLTQVTLTQILIESRGAAHLFSPQLLLQLVRMGDDALADFFGRWVYWALEVYLQTKQSARSLGPLNPFNAFSNPFARVLGSMSPWGEQAQAPAQPPPPPAPPPDRTSQGDDIATLRRELDALKRSVKGKKRIRR